jgi:hypothetical protein
MKILIRLIAACTLYFAVSFPLMAQEEQMAIVPGVFELNKKEASTLLFFKDRTDGFKQAILMTDEQGNRYFKVYYNTSRGPVEKNYPIKTEELESLREQYQRQVVGNRKDQSGRYYLITSVTANTLAQGSFMGNLFTREVRSPFGASYSEKTDFGYALPLLASAGAFAGILVTTKNKEITRGMANAHFGSSVLGYFQGAFLANMLFDFSSDNYDKGLSATVGLTSLATGWTAYHFAKARNASYAQTVAWNTGNIWGGVNMALVTLGLGIENEKAIGSLILLGSVGGITTMNHLHKKWDLSTGDYRAMNALAISGLAWGGAVIGSADLGDGPAALALLMGGTLGMAGGKLFPRQQPFTKVEGGLISLGTFLGGGFAGGLSVIYGADGPGVLYSYALGSTAGWLATALFLKRNQSDFNALGFLNNTGKNINVSLNPMGLGARKMSADQHFKMLSQNISLSAVNCRLTF